MRFDLCHYGLIGFHKEWRALQRASGSNLLERFVDDCVASGVDGCAVVSEGEEILRDTADDRFGILKLIAEHVPTPLTNHRDWLNKEYVVKLVEENYIIVEKDGVLVHLLNAQAVRVIDQDQTLKILTVGTNNIPDKIPLEDAVSNYFQRQDLVVIPKKLSQHWPPRDRKGAVEALSRRVDLYDAMVGYDAQLAAKDNLSAAELAGRLNLPSVAISNKHYFTGCGSCVEIPEGALDTQSEYGFLTTLKDSLRGRNFEQFKEPERLLNRLSWQARFIWGTRSDKHQSYTA